ncbi:N-acyl homoserine lactonase family protein [Tepidiforma bonchosmolovskayae]|uniref:N-acyl homoserine lactonase family protein n=1 Tax=Tepidiforma bonchosmolovskayae TaxID=2601677 RepID=A0ABX6C3V9_9CHLR|nr:N-acyl homoserine lactonase family protein [Tepidiforma bonchosmolovskayae]QFG03950.1 N-acyl homoserine lactonase family protein [Tepidiforma bonchosmolovskayae]
MGIKIRGTNLGYMKLDKELLVFPHPNYALNVERTSGQKLWVNCPALAYIIEHPDGLILWETGISTKVREEWLPAWQWLIDVSEITPEVCLEARLKQMGLAPEDFKYVIQGHLHCDHAGGLRLFEEAGAEIIVHEDEYKYVFQNIEKADQFFVREDFALLGRKRPTLIYGDQEILDGVKLISLPGHTAGTMGMLVRLNHTGWVLFTSDAMYLHESYGPPPVGSPIVWDPGKWASSVEKIRRIAIEHEATIFPGHDETGIKQHADGSSVFTPLNVRPDYVYE